MTIEERIASIEERRRQVVTIVRFSFWTPIIIVLLIWAGILPPMLFFIAYAVGVFTWTQYAGDRDRLESLIDVLKREQAKMKREMA